MTHKIHISKIIRLRFIIFLLFRLSVSTQTGERFLSPTVFLNSLKVPLYFLADTPGFSMLDFTRFNFLTADELPESFPEFTDCLGGCRYTKCTHTKEEDCAVLEKLRAGRMAESRHMNYVAIREEILKKPEWKRQKETEGKPAGRRKR